MLVHSWPAMLIALALLLLLLGPGWIGGAVNVFARCHGAHNAAPDDTARSPKEQS